MFAEQLIPEGAPSILTVRTHCIGSDRICAVLPQGRAGAAHFIRQFWGCANSRPGNAPALLNRGASYNWQSHQTAISHCRETLLDFSFRLFRIQLRLSGSASWLDAPARPLFVSFVRPHDSLPVQSAHRRREARCATIPGAATLGDTSTRRSLSGDEDLVASFADMAGERPPAYVASLPATFLPTAITEMTEGIRGRSFALGWRALP